MQGNLPNDLSCTDATRLINPFLLMLRHACSFVSGTNSPVKCRKRGCMGQPSSRSVRLTTRDGSSEIQSDTHIPFGTQRLVRDEFRSRPLIAPWDVSCGYHDL